jgi:hypothetical protein
VPAGCEALPLATARTDYTAAPGAIVGRCSRVLLRPQFLMLATYDNSNQLTVIVSVICFPQSAYRAVNKEITRTIQGGGCFHSSWDF